MSLRHALLATLLDGEASGYELAKRFALSSAAYWHAKAAQVYAELTRMEEDELVAGETVVQTGRPNKRLFSITPQGRAELRRWIEEPARPTAFKDELAAKVHALDVGNLDDIERHLQGLRERAAERVAAYEAIRAVILRGRTEEEFVATARRIGPYVALARGLSYERENVTWAEWALRLLATRRTVGRRRKDAAVAAS